MDILIHKADPQSRPVVITILTRGVCTVPTFQNLSKQNNFQLKIVLATGGNVGLVEWIIDSIHVYIHGCSTLPTLAKYLERKVLFMLNAIPLIQIFLLVFRLSQQLEECFGKFSAQQSRKTNFLNNCRNSEGSI